jgi:6-phosphogluconolactonase
MAQRALTGGAAVSVRWQAHADAVALREAARERLAAAAQEAIAARGAFHIVLAGGSTPRALYASLPGLETDWRAWHVYFGDERVLPAADPERNSRMAAEAWLDRVPVPRAQIHPIPTEEGIESAVRTYQAVMAGVGEFDLVLLGLGEDGHTASLFPGDYWGEGAAAPDVLAVRGAPKPPPERVSLSAHRLSRARRVLFLVSGAGKREAIARWRLGERIPAAAIQPPGGVDVLLDAPAWPEQ